MITADDLKQYGKVEICQEVNGKFHVRITEGFKGNAMETFELMKKISDSVGEQYPILDKCTTDAGMFDYVIKPKNK